MSDRITLTIPRERPFHRVAHLVLGGLAVRLNLTFENLEDLQLALDGLLEQEEDGSEVTVELVIDEGVVAAEVGPFQAERLRAELARDSEDEGEIGLARVLAAVVDDVELNERDGGGWVRLTKRVAEPAEAT